MSERELLIWLRILGVAVAFGPLVRGEWYLYSRRVPPAADGRPHHPDYVAGYLQGMRSARSINLVLALGALAVALGLPLPRGD